MSSQGGEDQATYENKLIKEYSKKLTLEFEKGYSPRNLYNMRMYYLFFYKNKILQPLAAILSWTHYSIILPLKNANKIKYYIEECRKSNLGKRELQTKIKNQEYERLDEKTLEKLKTATEYNIEDYIKHPIIIKNTNNYENISEKTLQKLILEDIPSFLKELGNGFTFIDNEYKIKIGNIIITLTYHYLISIITAIVL